MGCYARRLSKPLSYRLRSPSVNWRQIRESNPRGFLHPGVFETLSSYMPDICRMVPPLGIEPRDSCF